MELDTGAAVSLVSKSVWKPVKGPSKLCRSDMVLRTYNNSCLTVLGEAKVRVQYEGQSQELTLRVVRDDGPSLLGRDWLQYINVNWRSVLSLSRSPSNTSASALEALLETSKRGFEQRLGTMTVFQAELKLKKGRYPNSFVHDRCLLH